MESRWHLFPGQTLENTKISDRSHALHITTSAWGNVTKHLDRNKLIQDALDKDKQRKKYLEEGSKSMIENWDNSLENIRKRKERDARNLIEKKKDDRMQKFFEMRAEQEKIRKEYVDKVNKEIFMNTGNARQLTSAFIASETLYEREKQKELRRSIRKHEMEEEAKDAELIKRNAEKEICEKLEKQRLLREKDMQYREILKKEKEEKELRIKDESEKRRRKEAIDQVLAREELECLERKQKEDALQKKLEFQNEEKKRLRKEKERRLQLEKETKELDEVVSLYKEAKHTRDCLLKQRDKELKEALVARRDAVAKLVMAEEICKEEIEQKQMMKAIAERDKIEEAQVIAKVEFKNKMKQDRIDDRKQFIERREAVQNKEKELRKWEMLNRYKADEHIRKYDEKRNREQWKKILEYRKELLEQMDETISERKREKEIEQYIARKSFVNEDEKFFAYANEILELAKKKNRPTYPIEKAIKMYKITNKVCARQEKPVSRIKKCCGDAEKCS